MISEREHGASRRQILFVAAVVLSGARQRRRRALRESCAVPQEKLHDVLARVPRRKAHRFSIQRVRCRSTLEQEARRVEVATVDSDHERQTAARVRVPARIQ